MGGACTGGRVASGGSEDEGARAAVAGGAQQGSWSVAHGQAVWLSTGVMHGVAKQCGQGRGGVRSGTKECARGHRQTGAYVCASARGGPHCSRFMVRRCFLYSLMVSSACRKKAPKAGVTCAREEQRVAVGVSDVGAGRGSGGSEHQRPQAPTDTPVPTHNESGASRHGEAVVEAGEQLAGP